MQVNIKRMYKDAIIPTYATDGSGAFDFYAYESQMVFPEGAAVVSTGIAMEIPEGYVMLLFSRSGHGFKEGIRLGNCVGVIDSDYRGEIKICLRSDNLQRNYLVCYKERIAQGILLPIPHIEFVIQEELSTTKRGTQGFGSTNNGNF